jgi:hypothetical protein
MSADHLEQMEVRWEEEIAGLPLAGLFKLGEELGADLTDASRKTQVLRGLRDHVSGAWGTDEDQHIHFMENKVMPALDKVLAARRQTGSTSGGGKDRTGEPTYIPESGDDPRGPPKEDSGEKAFLGMMTKLAEATVSQRNILKLAGTIGAPKDAKNISYSNLMSQITDAQADGRKDQEIVRAIKRATAANSDIRSYLDTADSLDLTQVLEILQNFYREKSAGDLFSELSQICQGPSEKSTDFLLRAMQLRQRLTKTAKVEKKRYEADFVQETFLSAVKTGLTEESISAKLTPLLNKVKTPDGVLLREINTAEQEHEERSKRHQKKKVTVAQASAEPQDLSSLLKPLVESMASLQQQVKQMQEQKTQPVQIGSAPDHWRNHTATNRQPGATTRGGYRDQEMRDYRCTKCKANNVPRCNHCFKCLSPDHRNADCPKN